MDEDGLQEEDYEKLMRERAKRKYEDMANAADKPKKYAGRAGHYIIGWEYSAKGHMIEALAWMGEL